jgi:hypothetical protein
LTETLFSQDILNKYIGCIKTILKTTLGDIECHIIESTVGSKIGTSTLTSFFSEKYGFVRMVYQLLNNLEVNFWLIDFKEDLIFNDSLTISAPRISSMNWMSFYSLICKEGIIGAGDLKMTC